MSHESYRQFSSRMMKAGHSMSQVSVLWKAEKANRGGSTPPPNTRKNPVPPTTKIRGQRSLSASIPMVADVSPDIAAAWDIAEGIADYFSQGPESLERKAAAAYARAKGEDSKADQVEHDFGEAIGEALEMVLVRRGIDPNALRALLSQGTEDGSVFEGFDIPTSLVTGLATIAGAYVGGPAGAAIGGAAADYGLDYLFPEADDYDFGAEATQLFAP